MVQLQPIDSSNLRAVGYDPGSQTLGVQFHNGARWNYQNVPLERWEEFQSADSKGRFFGSEIRGKFTGVLVETDAAPAEEAKAVVKDAIAAGTEMLESAEPKH